jgi:hypothetical protein
MLPLGIAIELKRLPRLKVQESSNSSARTITLPSSTFSEN